MSANLFYGAKIPENCEKKFSVKMHCYSENNFVSSCFAGMLAFCVLYFASSLPDCTSLIAGVIWLNRKSRSIIDMLYEYFGLVLGCIDADLCK